MLPRSLSISSLLKQAAASEQTQHSEVVQPTTGTAEFSFQLGSRSPEDVSVLPSTSSRRVASPGPKEQKSIRFNEQVEQCIAVEMEGDSDDDELDPLNINDFEQSDIESGGFVMKTPNSVAKSLPDHEYTTNAPESNEKGKAIAIIPPTALKHMHDHNSSWNTSKLSPSSSHEILRPLKPSIRMLLHDDDDDDDDDESYYVDWKPPNSAINRRDSSSAMQEHFETLTSESSPDLTGEPPGMFMPHEKDDEDLVSERLFGKVDRVINTTRDMACRFWTGGSTAYMNNKSMNTLATDWTTSFLPRILSPKHSWEFSDPSSVANESMHSETRKISPNPFFISTDNQMTAQEWDGPSL
jgi:hypothetical protein